MRQIITSNLFCFSICVCFAQTQSELNDKADQDYTIRTTNGVNHKT